MSLIGTLTEIKIADVLRLFAAGRKTGLLTATAKGAEAIVRFQKGAVVQAACGRLQGEDAVLDLFGWPDGQLTFVPEEKSVTPNVRRDVESLIAEGVRTGDRVHRLNQLIPTDRVVFQMAAGPANDDVRYSVGAAEWRVPRHLDGVMALGEGGGAAGGPG